MTPCSPGIISGFCSRSAKASLSSSTKDSFLTATSWGLNVFTCPARTNKYIKRNTNNPAFDIVEKKEKEKEDSGLCHPNPSLLGYTSD